MLMMTKLSNFKVMEKIFSNFLYYSIFIFVIFGQKFAYSQTNYTQKELPTQNFSNGIKVSKLSKPSLGSLGVRTDANNLIGINIWQNMQAKESIEHLN